MAPAPYLITGVVLAGGRGARPGSDIAMPTTSEPDDAGNLRQCKKPAQTAGASGMSRRAVYRVGRRTVQQASRAP